MMRKLVCTLAFTCSLFANLYANGSFIYGDVHSLGKYPMVGGGIRLREGTHALDFSGNVSPVNLPESLSLFHIRGLYCSYPGRSGVYFGGGVGFLSMGMTPSFESAIGIQLKNLFIEATSSVPFNDTKQVWPGVSLGVGF